MPSSVSIIVINFNGGPEAATNIHALSEQLADTGWELVVVDNDSTDGSPDLIAGEVPSARLFREPANSGYAVGVNRGLAEASGDVLIVLNADVAPRPGSLSALVDAVDANRHYALMGGVLVDGGGRISQNTARALPRPADILREGVFLPARRPALPADLERAGDAGEPGVVPVPVIGGAVMGLHRETLTVLGPMDAEYFLYNEDNEWCRRAARKGLSVGVARGAVFDHRGGASTRLHEGPAFAARVLADFQYFCEGEGVPEDRVRRLWRVRLVLRSWLYRADARLGILGRRPESAGRAAVYRILAGEIASFSWSVGSGVQNCHPSRLFRFPVALSDDPRDPRPIVMQLIPNMEYGGAQRLVETLVTGSLSQRFRFEVLCQTHAGEIGEELRARGVPVHVAGMSGWLSPSGWRRFADYAALFEPDLVHSHLIPGDVAAHVGFGRRALRLSTKHNTDPKFGRTVRLVERFFLRGVSVLAVSDAVAASKKHLGPWGMLPPVLQSPPAVPVATVPAPLFREGQPVRIGAIGRLHPQKRLDIYLRAAAELERRFPGRFTFRVVGDGRELEPLKALAVDLGIDGHVDFRPAVPDVAAAMDDIDIMVVVSDYEGLALTILEAVARGRVPLVRRIPGADEALPDALARCYVDSASPEDVAEKVLEICGEPEHFAGLAREGAEWLARRSDYASVTGGLYDDILQGPERRGRALHLITRLIVGGAQENTIASVERVDPARYDSHLWTGPQTGPEGSLLTDARTRGIVVRMLPNMVREISPLKDLLMLVQLTRMLRRERFDIVHTHCSKAGIIGRIAARFAGVPHVTHTHHGWSFHDRMHPLLKWLFVAAEKSLAPWTHPMISVSNKTTKVGIDAGIGSPSDYRLIRSGIPLSRYYPDQAKGSAVRRALEIPTDHVVVCSVGRLTPQKNPLDFVKLAAALTGGHDNVTFLYVGDGPMRATVEAAADAAGLGDRLRLLGVRDDVQDLLRASDVFVLTSLWEGLPRVVLQSLASGVPVLAYDTAGIAEAVLEGKNGHLVPRGSVDEMASRLSVLVENAGRRTEMSNAAADEFDRSFSEDQMILDLENLYDEMVRSRKD